MNRNDISKPYSKDMSITPDVIKINNDNHTCILIDKHKLSIDKIALHDMKCYCRIPSIVLKHYDSEKFYLFKSKKNKKVWYLIKKSIMQEVVKRCTNIFPCKTHNGRRQINGFSYIVTNNYDDLNKLKNICDEVMNHIKSYSCFKRDYHLAHMIQCPEKKCKKRELSDIEHRLGNIYYGFTTPYLPTDKSLYILGIIQKMIGRYKYYHFNAPGGKKDMKWDEVKQQFYIEKLVDSVIREIWEELGIEFDKELFQYCLDLSRKKGIKPVNYTKDRGIIIYNMYLPELDKLKFEKREWYNPSKARYFVSLNV